MSASPSKRVGRSGAVAAHRAGAAPEAQTNGGMFTSLILILLTLVVYLFSLTLPDDTRRRAIHASLAKAFLFDASSPEEEAAPEGPVRLLSPARQRLRELEALLTGVGRVDREGDALVIRIPADRLFTDGGTDLDDRTASLVRVARFLAAAGGDARVEATAETDAAPDTARVRSLSRAVAVTRGLLASGAAGLDAGRLSAVGMGADPGSLDDPEAVGPGAVRVVLVDARGVL